MDAEDQNLIIVSARFGRRPEWSRLRRLMWLRFRCVGRRTGCRQRRRLAWCRHRKELRTPSDCRHPECDTGRHPQPPAQTSAALEETETARKMVRGDGAVAIGARRTRLVFMEASIATSTSSQVWPPSRERCSAPLALMVQRGAAGLFAGSGGGSAMPGGKACAGADFALFTKSTDACEGSACSF